MTELAQERCVACTGAEPVMDPADVEKLRSDLHPEWSVVDGRSLRRQLRFPTFSEAFAMATRIAMVAEAEGHHPEMTVGWGHVDVDLTTHAVGGLTRNDFIVAAKIDGLE